MEKYVPIYGIPEFTENTEEFYFYANELCVHLQSHKFVNAPHKHSTYITVLFTQGTGTHQIDFDTFEVCPGSVFLINPGQVHCWQLSEDVQGYVFFHTKEFYDQIFLNKKIDDYPFFYLQQNHPVIYLSAAAVAQLIPVFVELVSEYQQKLPYRNQQLAVMVDSLYIKLARLYDAHATQAYDPHTSFAKVKRLQKLIDQYYTQKKYPAQYADLMFISVRHLSRICNEVLGRSTSELILERITMEAKRMLIHSDITVSQVAAKLGYEDVSYFIRMFKKKVGIAPKEFQMKQSKSF